MNTWIWGPPKWKFLHSLSFSPDVHAHPGPVCAFLNTLCCVLPCKYCRESYGKFVHELEQQSGKTLHQTIQSNLFSKWMYDLHDKVNEKLDRQLALEAAKGASVKINSAQQDALCRKRQITFDCLTKRFVLRPVSFCAEDVWEFLIIFALNMDMTRNKASAKMQQQWQLFFYLLPQVATLAGASEQLVQALHLVRPQDIHNLPVSYVSVVVQAKAAFYGKPFTPDMVTEAMQIYDYAKASVCSHGSCK